MLRCTLYAVAVCAILPASRAADPDLSGSWLVTQVLPGGDPAMFILKVTTEGGKPTASVAATGLKNVETTVTNFKVEGGSVSFALEQKRNIQGRTAVTVQKFEGTVGKDGKVVTGSLGSDAIAVRAKLTPTDKTELTQPDALAKGPAAEAYGKVTQLRIKPQQIQIKMAQEQDAEKKAALKKELAAAREEVAEKLPAAYRAVIAQHPDTVAAAECALSLLRLPAVPVTPDDAAKLVEVVQKQSEPYGPRFARLTRRDLAEAVGVRKDVGAVAAKLTESLVKDLTDATAPAVQVKVLSLHKTALETAGKKTEAAEFDARIAKLEAKLDAEYLANVPPFKPAAFAGRKEAGANRVAVMELFTGAQCPPCVAADVAFDALAKSYKPTDLVLIQYHLHVPGPDPMTNPDAVARAEYYAVRGTPSTYFNGKTAAGGGGGMANAEGKYDQYAKVIAPILEQKADVAVSGKATRSGDAVSIAVSVDGAAGDDLKLRLLVVEDTVRYTGSNGLRFHHQVVRAMPGGADGVAVKGGAFKHTATADVAAVRSGLTKYLDGYAATERPFPYPARPLEMKDLKVIALVQNDATKEIVGAVQLDVAGKSGGSR